MWITLWITAINNEGTIHLVDSTYSWSTGGMDLLRAIAKEIHLINSNYFEPTPKELTITNSRQHTVPDDHDVHTTTAKKTLTLNEDTEDD